MDRICQFRIHKMRGSKNDLFEGRRSWVDYMAVLVSWVCKSYVVDRDPRCLLAITINGTWSLSGLQRFQNWFYIPSEKRAMLKGKNLLRMETFFYFRVALFLEGTWCAGTRKNVLSQKVGIFFPSVYSALHWFYIFLTLDWKQCKRLSAVKTKEID